jgi:hypothetical protein
MTEAEIEIELNRQISDYYHIERSKNFRRNVHDAQQRSKLMDLSITPIEKQESYHAYIARRYKEIEEQLK